MKATIDALVDREHFLEARGYRYSLRNDIYVNKDARKVFSQEFVEDKPMDVIERCIELPATDDWQFYFVNDPPASVKSQLIRRLNNG